MTDKRILERLSKRWTSAVDHLYQRVLNLGKLDRKRLALLFSLGLAIRLVGMFGLGDGDMEQFKAWTVLVQRFGLERL